MARFVKRVGRYGVILQHATGEFHWRCDVCPRVWDGVSLTKHGKHKPPRRWTSEGHLKTPHHPYPSADKAIKGWRSHEGEEHHQAAVLGKLSTDATVVLD